MNKARGQIFTRFSLFYIVYHKYSIFQILSIISYAGLHSVGPFSIIVGLNLGIILTMAEHRRKMTEMNSTEVMLHKYTNSISFTP